MQNDDNSRILYAHVRRSRSVWAVWLGHPGTNIVSLCVGYESGPAAVQAVRQAAAGLGYVAQFV